jgi:hypothetical protein
VSITSSPDGCHDVELESSSFYLCLPLETLPFEIGEVIQVSTINNAGTIAITGETHIVQARAGDTVLSPSVEDSYDISVDTQPGCEPHHDACGNYVTPLEVTFLGSGIVTLKAGQSAQRTDGGSTLYLVRAQSMPIRDSECTNIDVSQGDRYFESVLVTPVTEEL